MDLSINFDAITSLLSKAAGQGRDYLYEFEVYRLLSESGAETPPKVNFIPKGSRPSDDAMNAFPGSRIVLKIVSPFIIHKTEVGGVKIIEKEANRIRSAFRRMLGEVPENYAAWIKKYPGTAPKAYKNLSGDDLTAAVARDIQGILQVQFMPPDSEAFGNELIVGLRHTPEFGTIISAGLGGTDTELYARRFRKGQAIVAASVRMTDGPRFFNLFRQTISYRKLAGLTRGQRRIVTDDQLIECFESFIQMGNYYSQTNPDAPFILKELEINPFAFTDFLMVPLDGMCRFSKPEPLPAERPVKKIHHLLHPESIGIIGVSKKRKNFGRIILDNILSEGFKKKNLVILKENLRELHGIRCCKNLGSLKQETGSKLDLFIVAVSAPQVPALVDEIIKQDAAQTVMLIPGGIGETEGSRDQAKKLMANIDNAHARKDGGPVFLGANCMGVISRPGGYDTWFIPEEKLPKARKGKFHKAALISQSGAFMLHRSHQFPQIRPAYMISMGNQTDLTLGDMVQYFSTQDAIDVIAVYAEGFNTMDGLAFCSAVRQAVLHGKEIIFYKAGRTPEGKAATSSHTASLAGDYMVCESCVQQAGAIVARTFSEFQGLFFLSETLNSKTIKGNRIAAVSGAGFEAVGMADSIWSDDFKMELAPLGNQTRQELYELFKEKGLDHLVTLTNPLDINPAADDDTHARAAAILAKDADVDAVVISLDPMSPAMKTLDGPGCETYDMHHETGIKTRLIHLAKTVDIPIAAVVDGGQLYEPLRQALIENNIPVFNVCDMAIATLSLYIQGRLNADAIRAGYPAP